MQQDFTSLLELYKTKKTSFIKKLHPAFYEWIVSSTSFLPSTVTATQRLWHIWNNHASVPLCKHCENPVSWDIANQTYRPFCGKACAAQERVQTKKNATETPPGCVICGKAVTRGKDRIWHLTCSKACNLQHLKTVRASESEVYVWINNIPEGYNFRSMVGKCRPIFNTIMDMTDHLPTSYQISERIQWLQGIIKTKKEIITNNLKQQNITDTGEGLIYQQQTQLLISKGTRKCPVCMTNDRPFNYTTRRYSKFCSTLCSEEAARQVSEKREQRRLQAEQRKLVGPKNKNHNPLLNDPRWLMGKHYNDQWTKQQIAAYLGVDKETISNRFDSYGIESRRYASNGAELALVEFLKTFLPDTIITNDRTILKPKELDIYIPSKQLAIEYCGLYWHSDVHTRIDRSYHYKKMIDCQQKNIRLITLYENEWLLQQDVVKNKLRSILGYDSRESVYARHTSVVELTPDVRSNFLSQYHIQGDGRATISYGLMKDTELVAVMAMVYTPSTGEWLINRYATSKRVQGGFSKLLSHFKRTNDWKTIVTFADRRWSEGEMYLQQGFVVDNYLMPDYKYLHKGELVHKFNFRHKHLPKLLGGQYDPDQSETENTQRCGIPRVWDCGKIRYVMKEGSIPKLL